MFVGSGWPFDVPCWAKPVDSNQRRSASSVRGGLSFRVRTEDSRSREGENGAALVNHSPGGGGDEIEAGLPFGSSPSCYLDLAHVPVRSAASLTVNDAAVARAPAPISPSPPCSTPSNLQPPLPLRILRHQTQSLRSGPTTR